MSDDNDTKKLNAGVLSAAIEVGLEQKTDRAKETQRAPQEKLNEGVQQLRTMAREHGLEWPKYD